MKRLKKRQCASNKSVATKKDSVVFRSRSVCFREYAYEITDVVYPRINGYLRYGVIGGKQLRSRFFKTEADKIFYGSCADAGVETPERFAFADVCRVGTVRQGYPLSVILRYELYHAAKPCSRKRIADAFPA